MYIVYSALHVCGRAEDVPQNFAGYQLELFSALPC